MGYDFSQEEEQKEFVNIGPVPAGSIVMTRMILLAPNDDSRDQKNPLVKRAKSNLRQLYVELQVERGAYSGCKWRQTITLPAAMQDVRLTENQQIACRIGGATLKAILQAANRSLNVSDLKVFDGLLFPTKVKINSQQRTSQNGKPYWINEISQIITSAHRDYTLVMSKGELINESGAVTGTAKNANQSGHPDTEKDLWGESFPSESAAYDVVPF